MYQHISITILDGIEIPGAETILGYMPLRGDFNIEYDNEAEKLLSEMEFFEDDEDSEVKLKEDILKLYNTRLDERIKRKKFVIERGLLEPKKPLKNDREKTKEEKEIFALMRPFMRFCEGNEFAELVEGLIKEKALRRELDEMRLYKALGITKIEQIDKYLERRPVKSADQTAAQKKQALNKKKVQKKTATNKKYVELSENEKKLCTDLRVAEEDYAELKEKILPVLRAKSGSRTKLAEFTSKKMSVENAQVIYDFLANGQHKLEALPKDDYSDRENNN